MNDKHQDENLLLRPEETFVLFNNFSVMWEGAKVWFWLDLAKEKDD